MSKPLHIPRHVKQFIANLNNTDERYNVFSQALWQYRGLRDRLNVNHTVWTPGCTDRAVPGHLFHRRITDTHYSIYIAGRDGRWLAIIINNVVRVTWSHTRDEFPYVNTIDLLLRYINDFLSENMEISWAELDESDKELHTLFTDMHYGCNSVAYLEKLAIWASAKVAVNPVLAVKHPNRRFVRGYRLGNQNVFEIYKNDVIISLVDQPIEARPGARWEVFYGPDTSDCVILSCRAERTHKGGVVSGAFNDAGDMCHELAFEMWYHLSKPLIGVPY